jgi:hypothetical protein
MFFSNHCPTNSRPTKLLSCYQIFVCADSSSRSSFHQHDQGIVESDEPEEEAFNETLHKFEMLGIGCVRGGSTSLLTEDKCISEKDKKAGILRSENVVKLGFEWRSRMVVLSACNTAKGCVSTSRLNLFKFSQKHLSAMKGNLFAIANNCVLTM